MKKVLTHIAIAASLALTAPAYAQQGQQNQQGVRTAMGKVVDVRDIELTGMPAKHTLVRIENVQGKHMVINLGADAKAKKVEKGDRVAAVGKSARINGKPVLFAKYFGELNDAGRVGMKQKGKNQ